MSIFHSISSPLYPHNSAKIKKYKIAINRALLVISVENAINNFIFSNIDGL